MLTNRFTIALLALLAGTSFAAAEQVRGVVVKVDVDGGQLTIEARGAGVRGNVMQFTLGKDAQLFFLGSKAAALKDVPVGKNVQISYESQDGKKIAMLVRITAIKPAEPAGKPMETGPKPRAVDANALTGKLRRVALTEREIVLAMPGAGDKESYISLPVTADAKITRDDKAIKFDDLKEEETAVVKTEMRDGRKVAVALQTGKVSVESMESSPDEPSRIARIRQILKIADTLLELAEKQDKK